MNNQKGQATIGLIHLVGTGAAIIIAMAGMWLAQNNVTNSQIDTVKTNLSSTDQRVAKLEAYITTLQEDNKTIQDKLDKILLWTKNK